ncbi:asparaginase domain-containing protein [Halobacteriota archaeon]
MMYNKSKKHISIIFTGGTIGAYIDKGVMKVYDNPEELLQVLVEKKPEVNTFAELSIKRAINILSEDLVPSDWGKIAKIVAREINHNYADGIVITHGTDTLPFSSAALSFMLKGLTVPVVLTGSNLPLTAEGTDAVQHLYDSILIASKSNLAGVFVVFKGKDGCSHIHHGTQVRQMQPLEDYFESIKNKTLGYVKEEKIYLSNKDYKKRTQLTERVRTETALETNISYFSIFPGFDPKLIHCSVVEGKKAILLRLYHSGTACTRKGKFSIIENVKDATSTGIFVFALSLISNTKDNTPYPSVKKFLEMGVILLKDMSPESAIVKLMWVLGNCKGVEEIRKKMLENIAYEIVK